MREHARKLRLSASSMTISLSMPVGLELATRRYLRAVMSRWDQLRSQAMR